MATELIINATLPETRIALLENGEIQEMHIERDSERGIVGNIYKGKVIRVLPGMQAAFVDIGLEKAAFLYVDDIFFPDMNTPLVSPPLITPPLEPSPPSLSPSVSAVIADPSANALKAESGPAAISNRHARGGRGRWGRRGRDGAPSARQQPRTQGATTAILPESPEDHDRLQREYAKQMLDLDVETEAEIVAPQPPVAPVAEEPKVESAPVAVESSEDEKEASSEADSMNVSVSRTDPLIDAEAWASEVADGDVEKETNKEIDNKENGSKVASKPEIAAVSEVSSNVVRAKAQIEDEDDEGTAVPYRRRPREAVNIADLVKEGQEILVQVAKDPIGTKGARLTCHVSLPGRYLVFMPTVDHIGVSRRIESDGERRRLKETISKIRPPKTGVIVRTASGKQTDKKLKADLDYLVTTWNEIQKKFKKQRTSTLVYQDLTIVLRAIRDMFTDEVDQVIVDSKREHKAIMKFAQRFIPTVKDKVVLYEGDMPIFDAYGIETEISRALERKVWLKSGGYLVIDQAEALVAIDVNTGRYVGKKTLEETILKTNLEAVKEIAYQLRLRNCGGIIILDLIDMEKESNKEKVYKALEEALKKDRARPTIMKISQIGLVEMTRKRTRDSLVRSLCEPCFYCEGRGFIKNKSTLAYDIMRDVEREGAVEETNAVSIQCHPTVADVLLEDKRDVLEALEHEFNKKVTIRGNGAYHLEQYELVAHRAAKNIVWSSEERRTMLRQRIQERQQQLAAQARKLAEIERKKESEDRRQQQEAQRMERRGKLGEKRRHLAEERAAAREAGYDGSMHEIEDVSPIAIDTEESAESIGNTTESVANPRQPLHRRNNRGRRRRGSGGRHHREPLPLPRPNEYKAVSPPEQEQLGPQELAGSSVPLGQENEAQAGEGNQPRLRPGNRRRGRRGGRHRSPRPSGQSGGSMGESAVTDPSGNVSVQTVMPRGRGDSSDDGGSSHGSDEA